MQCSGKIVLFFDILLLFDKKNTYRWPNNYMKHDSVKCFIFAIYETIENTYNISVFYC